MAGYSKLRSAGLVTYEGTGETKAWVESADGTMRMSSPDSPIMKRLMREAERQGLKIEHTFRKGRKR